MTSGVAVLSIGATGLDGGVGRIGTYKLLLLAGAGAPGSLTYLRPGSVVRTRGGAMEALVCCEKECRKYEIALDGRGKSGD